MKPGGVVSNFVNVVFCRHLFMKTDGHLDISKMHYFFSNVGENLLIHPDEANQTVLARAFRRSKKARLLHLSDMLFFPIVFENHWFVFIVDIKDHRFVFLDSYYNQDSEYRQYVRERLIPSFQLHWDKYVDYPNQEQPVDMKFDDYRVLYPPVPHQGLDNLIDCGVFTMMFLENWKSPRTVLTSIFSIEDIPKIRIKFANELMFLPNNIGMKRLVTSYNEEDD